MIVQFILFVFDARHYGPIILTKIINYNNNILGPYYDCILIRSTRSFLSSIVGVGVSVSNNVIDDDDDQNTASNNASTSNQVSSVVNRVAALAAAAAAAAAGPSSSNTTADGNSTSGRYLLRTSFPSLFEANNRHDESVSGNGDASNESATPGNRDAIISVIFFARCLRSYRLGCIFVNL